MNWQVALNEGNDFIPDNTNFTNRDFISAIKEMTDKEFITLCYSSSINADRVLESHKDEKWFQDRNMTVTGARRL